MDDEFVLSYLRYFASRLSQYSTVNKILRYWTILVVVLYFLIYHYKRLKCNKFSKNPTMYLSFSSLSHWLHYGHNKCCQMRNRYE